MKMISAITCCFAAVAFVGCGVKQEQNKQVKPESQETVAAEIQTIEDVNQRPASMPSMVVVKVKEDANGEVLAGSDNAEMRALDASVADLSADSVAAVFAKANQVNANSDSLDADSSEGQHYWGWNNRRWYRGWGWGGYGYRNYRPYYGWGGYGYGYRYYCYW